MIPGGAEAEAGVAGLDAALTEGAEAGAAALEEGAGAEASALAKESAAEAKRLKEAEAAIGRSMPEPQLTNPYKEFKPGGASMSDFYGTAAKEGRQSAIKEAEAQAGQSGYASMRFPEEAEEAATTANPLRAKAKAAKRPQNHPVPCWRYCMVSGIWYLKITSRYHRNCMVSGIWYLKVASLRSRRIWYLVSGI